MTPRLRWAVYRDRQPLSPVYLGDVLAGADKGAAIRAGEQLYGAPVVVHRGGDKPGRPVTPELERAARVVTNRHALRKRGQFLARRAARQDGDA